MDRYSYSTYSPQQIWRTIVFSCAVLLVTFWSGAYVNIKLSQTELDNVQERIEFTDQLLVVSPAGAFYGSYGNAYYGGGYARVWMGIRYGKQPARFALPELAEPLPPGEIQKNYNAPECPQPQESPGPTPFPGFWMSEDCLFLSISAPRTPQQGNSSGYPVVVYFHPGGFTEGFGADFPGYDTSTFSTKGIVGVVVSYRLGIFGDFATTSENGNLQIADQRLALRWVQKNIAAFGGDPSKVTIMGASAGALSVYAHLVSPSSHGLYSAAALSSAPMGVLFPTLDEARNMTAQVFELAGCEANNITCMRNLTWEEVVDAQNRMPPRGIRLTLPFRPHVNPVGDLPVQPYVAIKKGSYPNIPLFVSFDRDDASYFVYQEINVDVPSQEYSSYVSGFVDIFMYIENKTWASTELQQLYPYTNDTLDGRGLLTKIATDGLSICPTLNMLGGAVANGKPPIYIYDFVHAMSHDHNSPLQWMRTSAYHALDYDCAIDNPSSMHQLDAAEIKMCNSLNSAFSNFMRSGDPNVGLPLAPSMEFPALNHSGHFLMVDTVSEVATYPRIDVCKSFWDPIQPIIE